MRPFPALSSLNLLLGAAALAVLAGCGSMALPTATANASGPVISDRVKALTRGTTWR